MHKKPKQRKNDEEYEEGFFEKASRDNILSDALLTQVTETDVLNMILTEQSFVQPYLHSQDPVKNNKHL
ncbi:MAG: hypothetical protein N4A57_00420 [Anaeromicrobium sp.]|jgi:hypothetical protein|uniref:hypothetical protein n=1 Tax=Anaeromicrobium sp. TaxID=1929132 RepID=UPI0025D86A23|nr:hypothetical protein [Anaeromicrobium sp.]MCT4592728.1 hypothetical protein [Anaeromicrobium sp.]